MLKRAGDTSLQSLRHTGCRFTRILFEPLERRLLLSSWYVSAAGGSDTNPGTLIQPLATIQQAANLAQPGDTVFIRGGVYHETVRPPRSGTAAAPITFRAYNNEAVEIDGADPVAGWSLYQGNIYAAAMPWTLGDGNDQVFVDDVMVNEARWPNTGPDLEHPTVATAASINPTINPSGLSTATLSSSALTDPAGTWVGATIHIAPGQGWVYQTGTVTAYTPGVLTYQYQQLTSYEVPTAGDTFFLTGKFQGLDAAGEWYRDPTSGQLYLWTPASDSPSIHTVEAKQRLYGFDLSGDSYIHINNVQFFACTINTDASSNFNSISNLSATYVSHRMDIADPWSIKYSPHTTGIIINGSHNTLDHITVVYSSGDGVFLGGDHNTLSYSTIHETDYAAGDEAAVSVMGNTDQVVYSTLYDTARSGIVHTFAVRAFIEHNLIHDIGLQTSDAGGIYDWQTDSQGTYIGYNVIYNATGGGFGNTGIFLDDASFNIMVDHNLAYNTDAALKMNPPTNDGNFIYNNTLIGNKYGLSAGSHPDMTGSTFYNNLFVGNMIWGVGAIQSNNLATTLAAAGFVNAAAGNYTLAANAPAIDAGMLLPPYTNGYTGSTADVGAFELGLAPWTPATAPAALLTRNAKSIIQAESFDSESGVTLLPSAIGSGVGSADNGDWVKYANVDFGSGVSTFLANVAAAPQFAGGDIDLHLDSTSGPLIASLTIASTGSWSTFAVQSISTLAATGIHDLYLVFRGGYGVCNLDWFEFA